MKRENKQREKQDELPAWAIEAEEALKKKPTAAQRRIFSRLDWRDRVGFLLGQPDK